MDTITLAMAKAYMDGKVGPGGAGYTEVKEEEILPPTDCPLMHEEGEYNGSYYPSGSYAIPYLHLERDGDHEKYDYYLYVDGDEFKYDYDPKNGSGWYKTDGVSDRFYSYFELIYPSVDPGPETVTASAKRVWQDVHSVDDKYIHNLPRRVSLLETGGKIFDEITLLFEVDTSLGAGILQTADKDMIKQLGFLSPGMRLNVQVDGISYQSEAVEFDGMTFFGNTDMLRGEYYGGIPIACYFNEEIAVIGVIGTQETHIISIAVEMGIPNYIKENKVLCSVELQPLYLNNSTVTHASTEYIPLIVGQYYLVITNSGTYTAVCKSHYGFREYIGNASLAESLSGTVDTGENFCVVAELGSGTSIVDISGSASCIVIAIGGGQSIIDPSRLVKTIDLDSYGIGEAIINLIGNGGGTETIIVNGFWHEVSTESMLRLEMNYEELRFIIDQCTRVRREKSVYLLSFCFRIMDTQTGTFQTIDVAVLYCVSDIDVLPGATVDVKVI